MIRTALLTVSNTRTSENDGSAKILRSLLDGAVYEIISAEIVRDDKEGIKRKLVYFSDELRADLILTTGGTGLGPADLTPEATQDVIDRAVPGLQQLMLAEGLKNTRRAALSRAVAGTRGKTLIVNLPGSPEGTKESLLAVMDIIPHSIEIIRGGSH